MMLPKSIELIIKYLTDAIAEGLEERARVKKKLMKLPAARMMMMIWSSGQY